MHKSNHATTAERLVHVGISLALLLLITTVLCLVVCGMQNSTEERQSAKTIEAKQNLHAIQLGVERFRVDNGEYPAYLMGGSAQYAAVVDEQAADPFQQVQAVEDMASLPDPLLREGYLSPYPQNPFMKGETKRCLSLHKLQTVLPGGNHGDPVRNGDTGKGWIAGSRFGPGCDLMGQVLADPRYPLITYPLSAAQPDMPGDSYMGIGYRFWDIWVGEKPLPFLPGQFFYKSNGTILSRDAELSASEPIRPVVPKGYIMGAYGDIREKGRDVIGDEQQVTAWTVVGDNVLGWDPQGVKAWPWTRSTTDPAEYGGSPYLPNTVGEPIQFMYGNPNGIRDSIAVVLTSTASDLP